MHLQLDWPVTFPSPEPGPFVLPPAGLNRACEGTAHPQVGVKTLRPYQNQFALSLTSCSFCVSLACYFLLLPNYLFTCWKVHLLTFFFLFWDRVARNPGCPQTWYIIKGDFELLILLSITWLLVLKPCASTSSLCSARGGAQSLVSAKQAVFFIGDVTFILNLIPNRTYFWIFVSLIYHGLVLPKTPKPGLGLRLLSTLQWQRTKH